MRKRLIPFLILALTLAVALGCQQAEEPAKEAAPAQTESAAPAQGDPAAPPVPDGCAPEFRALFDHAVVELEGEGDKDIVVITDPLCWHCRLAHKLLGEYPSLYGRMRYLFFPRKQFIGSDMAAWILEEAAGTDRLRTMVDYAYSDLKQPKTQDLMEARMLVLKQFTERFPDLMEGTTLEELYIRLQTDREARTIESTQLGNAARLPGTPVLVAGDSVVIGFGPGPWLKTLEDAEVCK